MNATAPEYRLRVEQLRSMIGRGAGMVGPPSSHQDVAKLDELTRKFLDCTVPDCYKLFLLNVGPLGAHSSVLYGVDDPIAGDAGKWPRKGIVYASLSWLENPKRSAWIAVGENDFEVFAISRNGARFATIAGGTEVVKHEFRCFEDMISYALDIMLAPYSHS